MKSLPIRLLSREISRLRFLRVCTLGHGCLDVSYDVAGGSAGAEDLADPHVLQYPAVLRGNDAAHHHQNVVHLLGPQQVHHLRKYVQVGPR